MLHFGLTTETPMKHEIHEKVLTVVCEEVSPFDIICYPVCKKSKLICRLVGRDFITDDQMKILEKLGYEVVCKEKNNLGGVYE